jgi:hypothetical protein
MCGDFHQKQINKSRFFASDTEYYIVYQHNEKEEKKQIHLNGACRSVNYFFRM